MLPNSPLIEVKEDGITVGKEDEAQFIPIETVVLATGFEPENSMAAELKGVPSEVYSIGDCVEPRKGVDAIYEGLKVGIQI